MKNQDFIKQTADKIIKSLKNGTAPWIKPWKADELNNTLPYNPTTNKSYNGINSINLMLAGYDDPRWLTYKQAQSINAQVRKGEKSTLIQYWQFSEFIDKLDKNGNKVVDKNGEIQKIEVKLERPKVFFANVFNANQIDNMPKLVNKPEISEFKANEKAEKLLRNSKAIIKHAGNKAYYSPQQDEIVLPPKESFLNERAYYTTAIHELGHWSGHESRLNRDLNNPFGSVEYAKEELRAEIASFLFNSKLGLNYDPNQHISYIDSWVKILEEKPTEIFKASSDATKIVNFLENLGIEQKQNIEQNKNLDNITQKKDTFMATKKTYLYVPFDEKDRAKNAGAKWDRESKMWYAPKGTNLNKLSTWLNPQEQKTTDVFNEFKNALNEAGLIIENEPIMDGKLHRVKTIGDKGRELSGAYVGFLNGHPAGFIQNFKTGFKENWKSSFSNLTNKNQEIEIKNIQENNNALKAQREKELNEAYEKTALKLEEEYNNAKWANQNHPYFKAKGLTKNYYLKQDKHGNILIPLKDINGKHWASQRIFQNGDKVIGALRSTEEKQQNITYPAKKQGNFFLLGAKNLNSVKEVFVCEGFATAASVYEATKNPTIMGVDAGNLKIVIKNVKEKFPKMKITIAADNDIKKELNNAVNVGKKTAFDIQQKNDNIKVVLPNFTNEEVNKGLSDFNDLMQSRGLEEVKKQIKEQLVKQLRTEKALNQSKSIKREISAKKDIAISL